MRKWLYVKNFLFLWLPVVVQMSLIFYFSSQPSDSAVLEDFPLPGFVGHLTGYGLLGLFLYRAFNRGFYPWQVRNALKSTLFGLLYAISDEIHQLFVPGREASLTDVLIDLAGVLAAIIFIRLYSLLKDCFFPGLRLK